METQPLYSSTDFQQDFGAISAILPAHGGNGTEAIPRYLLEKGIPPDQAQFLYERIGRAFEFLAGNRAALEEADFLGPDSTFVSGHVIAALYSYLFRMPWKPGKVPRPPVDVIVRMAREQENL